MSLASLVKADSPDSPDSFCSSAHPSPVWRDGVVTRSCNYETIHARSPSGTKYAYAARMAPPAAGEPAGALPACPFRDLVRAGGRQPAEASREFIGQGILPLNQR